MTRKNKAWLLTVQILVSLSLLAWLFLVVLRDQKISDLVKGFHSSSPFWIVFAACFTLLAFVLATYRWREVSLALGAVQPFRRMFSHFMAGQFISSFLPSTIGGDVLRMTRFSTDIGNPHKSFASVIIDRFTGWPILAIISLFGFIINTELFRLGTGQATTAISISAGVLLAFTITIFLATNKFAIRKLENVKGVWRYLSTIHDGLVALRYNWKPAIQVGVVGLAMQFSLIVAAFGAVKALGILGIGFTTLMAYLPIVFIVQVLPISVGGFGVRESALVVALSSVNVNETQAIQLGLMLAALTIGVGLIGAPALSLGGIKAKTPTTRNDI